jgi:hypothetical protein
MYSHIRDVTAPLVLARPQVKKKIRVKKYICISISEKHVLPHPRRHGTVGLGASAGGQKNRGGKTKYRGVIFFFDLVLARLYAEAPQYAHTAQLPLFLFF